MSKDFSHQAKEQLYNSISAVEPYNNYEFTNYNSDGWCYFADWINRLGLRSSINAVNSYQSKVTHKNENAKRQISNIYEKAQSIDARYGNILAGFKNRMNEKNSCLNKLDLGLNCMFFPSYMKMSTLESIEYLKTVDKEMSDQQDIIEKLRMILYEIIGSNRQSAISAKVTSITGRLIGCPAPKPTLSFKFPTNKWLVDADDFVSTMENLLSMVRELNGKVSDSWYKIYIKNIESAIKTIAAIDKKTKKSDKSSLISDIASYIGTLCGLVDEKPKNSSEIITSWLKLGKSSIKVEKGLYDYFIKTLNPYEASKLADKFGKGNIVLSAISGIAGVGEDGVKMHDVLVDENSNIYDKISQTVSLGGSIADLFGKVKIATMSGTKSLRIISNIEGTSKGAINQILVTDQSVKYTTSKAMGKKIANANNWLTLAEVCVASSASGIKRFGEVSKDGKVDIKDGASVGIYSATNGLSKLASSVTLGVVSFDGDETAKELENDVTAMVNSNSELIKYIGNKNNPWVLRALASGCGAVELVGKKVVVGAGKIVAKAEKAAKTVWTVHDELNKAYSN
ncbi:hypothetical protein [Agathobacter sp.]